MKFKTDTMKLHFRSGHIHPDIVKASSEFEAWSNSNGLPEPTVSDLFRTKGENGRIYLERFKDLRDLARKGVDLERLSVADQKLAAELRPLTDVELWAMAQHRKSWHCSGAAVDFSGNDYSETQSEMAADFFRRFEPSRWEVLRHVVTGTKPHFHLGRKDKVWAASFGNLLTS